MTLHLVAALQARGYVPFLLLGSRGGELWPRIPPGTETICFERRSWPGELFQLARFLRQRRPAILFSSMIRCNMLALWARALSGVKTRIVVREHVVVSAFSRSSGGRSALAPLLYRGFARRADAVLAVSAAVAGDLARLAKLPGCKVRVIHNPVLSPDYGRQLAGELEHPFFAPGQPPVFLGVGWLVRQKDFATLISAFAVCRRAREARLVLIGDGPQRAALQAQCRHLEVARDVVFLGFRENRMLYMKHAAALVLSSRVEGFPNVLVEGLGAGTQVISTDCPGASRYILEDGRFGTLVPVGDCEAMARAMLQAVYTPRPVHDGCARAQQFTADRTARAYEQVIAEFGGASVPQLSQHGDRLICGE